MEVWGGANYCASLPMEETKRDITHSNSFARTKSKVYQMLLKR